MRTISLLFILFSLYACNKGSDDLPKDISEKPKSISIKYYEKNELVQASYYFPVETANPNQYSFKIIDTSFIDPNFFFVYSTETLITSDYTGKTITEATLKNNKAEQVTRFADGSFIKTPMAQYYNNLNAVFTASNVIPGMFYNFNATINTFKDSAQLQPGNPQYFTLNRYFHNDTASYLMSTNRGRSDSYSAAKDTMVLEDMNIQSTEFSMLRYNEYFLNETPWYKPNEINRATYRRQSPSACSEFKLQNGFLKTISLGNYEYRTEFVPLFERKVNYSYSKDTSGLYKIIAGINPGLADPAWYYIDYYRRMFGKPEYGEGNDIYNTFEWSSSSSTDSVFTIINGQKQFMQSCSSHNVFEKDAQARIIKIIRRVSNKDAYKIMAINY